MDNSFSGGAAWLARHALTVWTEDWLLAIPYRTSCAQAAINAMPSESCPPPYDQSLPPDV